MFIGTEVDFDCRKNGKIHPELDVAVLTLPKGKRFKGRVYKTISLGSPNMTPKPGTTAIVAGWGIYKQDTRTTSDSLLVRHLQYKRVFVLHSIRSTMFVHELKD